MSGPRRAPLKVLLLGVQPRSTANTIRDHIAAFRTMSRHRIFMLQNYLALNPFSMSLRTIPRRFPLESYDVFVAHYSNYMALHSHFDPATRERLRDYRGLKVAFIQDEYRTVDATVQCLQDMKFDILFTCVPEAEVEKVYPSAALPGLTKITTLTGFVPQELLSVRVPPLRARPVDVGYRARVVPFWLGRLGTEKWQIAEAFRQAGAGSGLKLDVSSAESDRLYGADWTRFLLRCKAVLGVESGSSVFDFSGELQKSVDAYVAAHPGATYEEVHHRFLAPHEGLIRLNQISPRCFEAAALRTAQVLYEGDYSGILKPWRHYVPLKKDFSNFAEVEAAIRDVRLLQEMADRTYEEVALNPAYSYQEFIARFDTVIEEEYHWRKGARLRSEGLGLRATLRSQASLTTIVVLGAIIETGVPSFVYRMIYKTYIKLVPEKLRDKWRPFMRRYIVKG